MDDPNGVARVNSDTREEHRLAIMTAWSLLGSFGFCFVLSGFSGNDPVMGLLGFAAFVAAFVAHLILNRIFATGFSPAQVALGLSAFTVAVLCFILSSVFDPAFGETDRLVGFAGFGALTLCFVLYLMINYGVRGSYAMLHRLHRREHARP